MVRDLAAAAPQSGSALQVLPERGPPEVVPGPEDHGTCTPKPFQRKGLRTNLQFPCLDCRGTVCYD